MSIPVPRDPTLTCVICEVVFDSLDEMFRAVRDLPTDDPTVAEAHILASICQWWTANSLDKYSSDPVALFGMFADALATQGFDPQKMQALRTGRSWPSAANIH